MAYSGEGTQVKISRGGSAGCFGAGCGPRAGLSSSG